MIKRYLCLGLLSFTTVSTLYAEDGFDDEFDDEFSDSESIKIVKTQEENKAYEFNGSVKFFTSYNYNHDAPISDTTNDFRGFSSAKFSTDLKYNYEINDNYKIKSVTKLYYDSIYDIKSSSYPTVPEDYDKDININELYLQGKLSTNKDITIGRQIVVWGKSDNIRITDTINPLDNTTPGLTDIKDLRLGRAISKLDYFKGKWEYSFMLLHENRYSKMPTYGSDFAPNNPILASMISVDEPANSIKNSGVALSVSGNLTGQDIAFYYSNQYIDNTIYRSNMLGIAYNKVFDSILLKTEIAYFDNYDSNTVEAKMDALGGVEYTGIKDGSVSLEIANKDDIIQYALRFNQSYLNDTLDFTTLVMAYGKECEDGGFTRVWLDYDIDDNLALSVGIIDYITGDSQKFQMIKDNDRVFTSLEYSF